MSTYQQLHEIPDLATEAWLTIDHPHRDAHNTGTKPTKAATQPAPTNLHALTALQVPAGLDPEPPPPLVHRRGATDDEILAVIGDQDNTGPLLADLLLAVRVIVEEFADQPEQLPDWPDHTWSSVCAWLRLCAPLWTSDPFTEEWVGVAVRKAHTGLRQLARTPKPVELPCLTPGCQGVIRPLTDDGIDRTWPERCDDGHDIDRHLMAERIRLAIPVTRARIIEEVKRPPKTVDHWITQGWLRPVDNRRPRRYSLGDALTLNATLKPGRKSA